MGLALRCRRRLGWLTPQEAGLLATQGGILRGTSLRTRLDRQEMGHSPRSQSAIRTGRAVRVVMPEACLQTCVRFGASPPRPHCEARSAAAARRRLARSTVETRVIGAWIWPAAVVGVGSRVKVCDGNEKKSSWAEIASRTNETRLLHEGSCALKLSAQRLSVLRFVRLLLKEPATHLAHAEWVRLPVSGTWAPGLVARDP